MEIIKNWKPVPSLALFTLVSIISLYWTRKNLVRRRKESRELRQEVQKCRKKHIVVNAVQFRVDNIDTVKLFCDGTEINVGNVDASPNNANKNPVVNPNDWIFEGPDNEFYACKAEVFHDTYIPLGDSAVALVDQKHLDKSQVQKFVPKTVLLSALQFKNANMEQMMEFCQDSIAEYGKDENGRFWLVMNQSDKAKKISSKNSKQTAYENDWIVKGMNGQFWTVKEDLFNKTYELL